MVTFPSLLNIGEPLIFQGVPAPRTVSPFASQLTSTGLLPLPSVPVTPPAPAPAPAPAPTAAPSPVAVSPLLQDNDDFSFGDQTNAGFSTAPDPSAVAAAEQFGLTSGAAKDIASAYASQRADEVAPMQSFGNLGNVLSQPLSATLNQVFDRPEAVPGAILGMAVPGAGIALSAMANLNEEKQAYNRAMTEMGQPGYSYGTINGQQYSISPGPFGYGRVMSGVVPDWFDIDMHDKMQSIELGIDPNTGTGIDTTAGVAGYNQLGQYVDQYGNISVMGSMQDLESLAAKHGISKAQAKQALDMARNLEMELSRAIAEVDTRDYSYDGPDGGFDGEGGFGSGGVEQASYEDAVTTQAFDQFGAAFDEAAAAAEAASEDDDLGLGEGSDF